MDTIISFANTLITIHDKIIDRAKKHTIAYIVMIDICYTIFCIDECEEIGVFV